ncbi:hypothetical protein Tco_0516942 [Tanacetum coccineum]
MTSNSVELVNALTQDVRKLPITMLMDWCRDLLQKWYYECRDKHEDAPDDELTERATAKVNARIFAGLSSVAQLAKPCLLNRNIKGTYEGIIYPLQDVSSWHTPHEFPLVLPPIMGKNLPGRPKRKNRIPSQGEGQINNKCGMYGAKGHNRTACNVPLPKQQTNPSKRVKSTHDPSGNKDSQAHQEPHEPNHDFNVHMIDEILNDLLKREFNKQQRLKDQKGKGLLNDDKASLTGTHIPDDLNKKNDNVEVVLNNPKKKKLKEKVIILDSDASTKSLERSSFSDIPPSTHPFKTSFDNAFDSRYEDTCNSDDTWEPKKTVTKITSKYVLKGKPGTSSVILKAGKDDHGTVFKGKPRTTSVF